jgi:replicative DNA helicase
MQEDQLPGKIPPHNEEAERALLGALLVEPMRIPEVAESLQPGDFFNPRHNAIYETLVALTERSAPIDFVSVGEALAAAGKFQQVGGRAFLAELSSCVTSSAHVKHHARIVTETSTLRRLISEATDIISGAYSTRPDGESVQKLLDMSEHRIFQVAGGRDTGGPEPLSSAIEETFRRIDSATHRSGITGLPSGYYELDEMLCGFNAGELTVIAARPSMGKTAFVLNIIDHAALRLHKPVIANDLPAGGRRLDQTADGYVATVVSGEVIAENGVPTAARPGKLVRGRQPAPA